MLPVFVQNVPPEIVGILAVVFVRERERERPRKSRSATNAPNSRYTRASSPGIKSFCFRARYFECSRTHGSLFSFLFSLTLVKDRSSVRALASPRVDLYLTERSGRGLMRAFKSGMPPSLSGFSLAALLSRFSLSAVAVRGQRADAARPKEKPNSRCGST